MPLSATEQYLLELINRARLDPEAEAARIGIDLNRGLSGADLIGGAPKQVLAPNDALSDAARAHSQWMLAQDVFSHTGSGGSDAGDRIGAAGYRLGGTWTWGENLALTSFGFGTSADDRLARLYLERHTSLDLSDPMQLGIGKSYADLFFSPGHRENTFDGDFREIGIGQVRGDYKGFDVSMLTEDFAASGGRYFVTGAAWRDSDGDGFYSIGEGLPGIRIAAGGGLASSAGAGGYALAVTPGAALRVEVSTAARFLAALTLDMDGANAKLDAVDTGAGWRIDLSASARLEAGVGHLRLLGAGDLDLSAGAGAQHLVGNRGDNLIQGGGGRDWLEGGDGHDRLRGQDGADRLEGGALRDWLRGGRGDDMLDGGGGDDALRGGAGNDTLTGGGGHDLLDGGAGNDVLSGGAGRDRFIFNGGDDRIADFANDIDTVEMHLSGLALDAAVQRAAGSVESFLALARQQGGDLVFDLGDGHRLTIAGVTDARLLADDLILT